VPPSAGSEWWNEATAERSHAEQLAEPCAEQLVELSSELHGEGGHERSILWIVSRG